MEERQLNGILKFSVLLLSFILSTAINKVKGVRKYNEELNFCNQIVGFFWYQINTLVMYEGRTKDFLSLYEDETKVWRIMGKDLYHRKATCLGN